MRESWRGWFLVGALGCTPAAPRSAPPEPPASAPERSTADYVIVAPSAFRPALEPLLAHRGALGHATAFVALESLPSSSAEGLAAEVALLRERGLRHLLLVGDPAGPLPLPAFHGYDPTLGNEFASDQPYAFGDSVAVGRVPARNAGEAALFVHKLLAYEAQPAGAWQRRVAVFAGPAKFGALADTLIEAEGRRLLGDELPYDFDLRVLFAKPDSPFAYRPDRLGDKVVSELERGALVAVYVGHGSANSFDRVSYRGVDYLIAGPHDFARLHIERGQPFFVSLTCSTGRYAEAQPSVAEQLVLSPGGPVAVFAAAAESHPYANALYAEAFLRHFFAEQPATVGDGLVSVRATMVVSDRPLASLLVPGDLRAIKEANLAMYNLFGDPATRLRYPEPARLRLPVAVGQSERLALEVEAAARDGAVVTVTIERERGAPAPNRVPPHELDALPLDEAFAAMERNHDAASELVLVRAEGRFAGGRAALSLPAPAEPGSYVVKALVLSASGAHATSARIDVTAGEARAQR